METTMNDKLSVKNLLFTKAIPNYEIPYPVNGHKTFNCIDCGDKFVFESSYNDHINRKSVLITYTCRICNQTKVFHNRCSLLQHIRSHTFKTATINVSDLKLEPLPLHFFNFDKNQLNTLNSIPSSTPNNEISKKSSDFSCYECKQIIKNVSGTSNSNRALHFMQYTNVLHTCPICLFTLPTTCGLKAHLRLHVNKPPFFCTECGEPLSPKNLRYPFLHNCEGFKMMRVASRLICPIKSCPLLHPNEFKEHVKLFHLKKVYKCPYCVVACFNRPTIDTHLKGHNSDATKSLLFYQCDICPGKLVIQKHLDTHVLSHATHYAFACKVCGMISKNVIGLIKHNLEKHSMTPIVANILKSFVPGMKTQAPKAKRVYRVVKRCEQCKRNFTYKCKYDEIPVLPNECPFKCTSKLTSKPATNSKNDEITCTLCKVKIPDKWDDIKKHYFKEHKNHRCLDAKLSIKRLSVKECMKFKKRKTENAIRKIISRNRKATKTPETEKESNQITSARNDPTNSEFACSMCEYKCDSKEALELHMTNHKDPCMAYQCMECGQSFVVKPSFSKHLLLEHNISDVEDYICKKKCYNENAFNKYQDDKTNEPLKENQCKICREQYQNSEDLEKHFRVHGMAFLLKSTGTKG